MPHIGPMELMIVLVLVLIVLGPGRMPEAGRSLGRGLREFKDSLTGGGSRERRARRRSSRLRRPGSPELHDREPIRRNPPWPFP